MNRLKKNNENIKINLKKTIYYQDWNENIANNIAKQESIILTKKHWEIIYFIREFYSRFNRTPSMRMLSKSLKIKLSNYKSTSLYLYTLFPKGPAQQASKIAGLPKPNHCL
ncbi:MAG: TusE/DsrC/DsvC family sulfur relay protein [Buchnera aphidicola (Eriosoma harunire)]